MYDRMLTYEKENEASLGNIVRWGFKAFDKVTDLIPAKYGMKIIGKTATFTRKFAQGMSKTTLVLHEGHRLWHIYNEVANENKEHPKMITKEALEMYTKDIDRDLAKLDADYKDSENNLGGYKLQQNEDNLTKEFGESIKIVRGIEAEEKSVINEYKNTIRELKKQRDAVSDTDKLYREKTNLENDLSNKDEELNIAKDQLKQKNPSYARAQQRIQARRVGKIPEMVMITNK
ncbi:hypothetical protein PAWBP_2980 [Paulownia witches'-broom phytoplasma]|nr:hypothetical protein PAWBP_2980 [Paulownia witches'-broom phytoplasma]